MPSEQPQQPKDTTLERLNAADKFHSLVTQGKLKQDARLTDFYLKQLTVVEHILDTEKDFEDKDRLRYCDILLTLPTFDILQDALTEPQQALFSKKEALEEQKGRLQKKLTGFLEEKEAQSTRLSLLKPKLAEMTFTEMLNNEHPEFKLILEETSLKISPSKNTLKDYYLEQLQRLKQHKERINLDEALITQVETNLKQEDFSLDTAEVFIRKQINAVRQIPLELPLVVFNEFEEKTRQYKQEQDKIKDALLIELHQKIDKIIENNKKTIESRGDTLLLASINAVQEELTDVQKHLDPLNNIIEILKELRAGKALGEEEGENHFNIETILSDNEFLDKLKNPRWREQRQFQLIQLRDYVQEHLPKLPRELQRSFAYLSPEIIGQDKTIKIISLKTYANQLNNGDAVKQKLEERRQFLKQKCDVTPKRNWSLLEKHYEKLAKAHGFFGVIAKPWNILIAKLQDMNNEQNLLKNPKGFRYLQYDFLYKAVKEPKACLESLIGAQWEFSEGCPEPEASNYEEQIRLYALNAVQSYFQGLGLKLLFNVKDDLEQYVYHTRALLEFIDELRSTDDETLTLELDQIMQAYEANIQITDIANTSQALLDAYNKLGPKSALHHLVEERQVMQAFFNSELPIKEKVFFSSRLYEDGRFTFKCVGGITAEQYQKFFLSAFHPTPANPKEYSYTFNNGDTYKLILGGDTKISDIYLEQDGKRQPMSLEQTKAILRHITTQFSLQCAKADIHVFNGINFVDLHNIVREKQPELAHHIEDCSGKRPKAPFATRPGG